MEEVDTATDKIELESTSVPLSALSKEDLDKLGMVRDLDINSFDEKTEPPKKTPRPSLFD